MRLDHLLSKEDGSSRVQSSRINPTKTEKVRVVVCYLVIKAVKSLINISGGDALRGHTRSHPEHDG